MKLAIDLDGVFADFNTDYRKLLNWPGLPEISDSFPSCWHWDVEAGVPKENTDAAWQHIEASGKFWLALNAYPSTKADLIALGQAIVQGHDVYFLTSRPGFIAKLQSEVWLRIQGFTFAPTVLIAGGPATKGAICAALGIDAIVDDRPENLLAVAASCPARLFLFDRPWNRTVLQPQVRVRSVTDMLDALDIHSTGAMTNA